MFSGVELGEGTWKTLLDLKRSPPQGEGFFLYRNSDEWGRNDPGESAPRLWVREDESGSGPAGIPIITAEGTLENASEASGFPELEGLLLYLPLITGRTRSLRGGRRPFVAVHLAQSLDGRVATRSGDSKWISNEENLVHAHRMRALCDCVLVGRKTVEEDDPRLTTRRVAGPDPVRVILDPKGKVAGSRAVFREAGDTLRVLGKVSAAERDSDRILYVGESCGRLDLEELLRKLKARGIHSVFVEGGAVTASAWLESGLADQLQIHVSPVILGSGIPSIQLPEISKVSEATRYRSRPVLLGNEVLFSCTGGGAET